MCSLSACPIGFLFNALLIIANKVSVIGRINSTNGINNEVSVTVLNPNNMITLIIRPKKVLPVSPINIFAGGKLNTKKPKVDPSIINDSIMSKPLNLFRIRAITPIVRKYIEDIHAHKPSSPSIRLTAFIIPTIISIVTYGDIHLKFNDKPNIST